MAMESDFVSARQHLEQAQLLLTGPDEKSAKVREALDLLIETLVRAEPPTKGPSAEILPFPTTRSRKAAKG